jgi:hypothetical protein
MSEVAQAAVTARLAMAHEPPLTSPADARTTAPRRSRLVSCAGQTLYV